jgi:hypothetical protein
MVARVTRYGQQIGPVEDSEIIVERLNALNQFGLEIRTDHNVDGHVCLLLLIGRHDIDPRIPAFAAVRTGRGP